MWYYTENEQQRGPVTETDLAALHRDGKINSYTLVWREGMANWQPLGEANPGLVGMPSQPNVPPPAATPGIGEVVCSQCGGTFPASEVIRYSGAAVCAVCKPIFVQKLKEGATVTTGPMEFAGFGTRFAAYFVDGIITGIVGIILGAALGAVLGATGAMSGAHGPAPALAPLIGFVAGFGARAAYFIYFTGKSGQTPGKKMCKIRVVNADGSQITYGKATGRFFGYILSSLILCIGYLMATWDGEKRALHDRLCDTRVVKV